MDLHTDLVKDRPGAVDERGVATEKGLQYLTEYIQAIREVVTYKSPLAADHFGPLTVKDANPLWGGRLNRMISPGQRTSSIGGTGEGSRR